MALLLKGRGGLGAIVAMGAVGAVGSMVQTSSICFPKGNSMEISASREISFAKFNRNWYRAADC